MSVVVHYVTVCARLSASAAAIPSHAATGCDNVPMTALFAGLTTLDVLHRLDHVPDPLLKVTSTDFTMAAGGPATNAAVTYAALSAASRALSGSDDEAGATSADCAEPGDGAVAATQVYELTVEKNFRRSGHASRLLAAVADLTSGQLRVWLGVDDEERQRFYTSAGFEPSGAVRVLGDGLTQHMWWADRD